MEMRCRNECSGCCCYYDDYNYNSEVLVVVVHGAPVPLRVYPQVLCPRGGNHQEAGVGLGLGLG